MNNLMAGKTKNTQNYISAKYPDGHVETIFTPLAPYETPEALDRICEEYNRVIGNMEVEPLIAIPIFIHDFLCIHPFNDGNGRMSRLLTTLLLYRASLNKIGRFNKQDIRELCPALSISSIEGALRKMVASGELKREGSGKSTYYIRLK